MRPLKDPDPSVACKSQCARHLAGRVILGDRVHGVGFRDTARDIAKGFEVCCTVKNLPEGTVELEVMAEREEVEAFLKEIAEESALARRVMGMHVESIPPLDIMTGFTTER